MIKSLFLLILFSFSPTTVEKIYFKNYFENGNLKSEGWISQNQKVDYWYYYYENGTKKSEGHFEANKKINWWLFYNQNGTIEKKVEFKNNIQEGLCLIYKNGDLVKGEQFTKGIKTKEWNSISAYKEDNP